MKTLLTILLTVIAAGLNAQRTVDFSEASELRLPLNGSLIASCPLERGEIYYDTLNQILLIGNGNTCDAIYTEANPLRKLTSQNGKQSIMATDRAIQINTNNIEAVFVDSNAITLYIPEIEFHSPFNEIKIESTYIGEQGDPNKKNIYIGSKVTQTPTDSVLIQNTVIGHESLSNLIDGKDNVALGYIALESLDVGSGNLALGTAAGVNMTYSEANTFIGTGAQLLGSDSLTNSMALGNFSSVDCDYCASIGGTGAFAMKVGIGTSNPTITTSIHHGGSGPVGGDGLRLANDAFNKNTWELYTVNSNGSLLFYENNTPIKELKEDGSFVNYSDSTLKTNIQYLEDGFLEKLNNLKPASYTYDHLIDKPNNISYGLIAQEVQEILPEVVHEIQSDDNSHDMKLGVSYVDLIPFLIKGMQEQQAIIEALSSRIEVLESIE